MLDRRERSGDLLEGVMAAQDGHQSRIWTALPGILQSWDPAKRTCVVQPSLKALVAQPDGTEVWRSLPLLVDCPIVFPGGGDVVVTFPLAQGDEGLVVFASRCIDAWWQSGGVQVQAEVRMHDLSDGFFVPGAASVPRVETAISTTEAQMRTRDGARLVGVTPGGAVRLVAPGSEVKCTAGRVDLTGTLYINGKAYLSHDHMGHGAGSYTDGVHDP